MKKIPKLDVHLVEHTHWDREWYFTSDDSRTMLYYDMKFMIDHLLKNDDKFTYDGQSSIIDDFLKYAPEWKSKLEQVVKAKKLYVGPFYTAVDNTIAASESIVRNLEMGQYLAQQVGHSMEVGYLPDTFGHNNQIPQILKMNGLTNLSFYRGLDPVLTDNKLYFNYQAPDGSQVLGHWQTHYTTRGFGPQVQANQYTKKWFYEKLITSENKAGDFSPSVKSYEKRNFDLPIALPIGTDQRPYSMKMPELTTKINKEQTDYHFINSSYEDFLKAIETQIATKKLKLKTITSELRTAKTGRVHRTATSSRMDIKQRHFELEQVLINILEPMSVLCHQNGIDVPWKMIESIWKELHKSSAHDSYACSNEDVVNTKLKNRLQNAIRIAHGVVAMLSRVYASKIVSEDSDKYQKLLVFNYKNNPYQGSYQIFITVKCGFENGQFKLYDGAKKLTYSILERNNQGTHERDALLILIHNVQIDAFNHKVLTIKYNDQACYLIDQENKIEANGLAVTVNSSHLTFERNGKVYDNLIKIALDPSVGDTYDHSPITFNDQKYEINNFQVIERASDMNTIKVRGTTQIPSGIEGWAKNQKTILQDVEIQITILNKNFHFHIKALNKSKNARMIFLVDTLASADTWYHDQQYSIYHRTLKNADMASWQKPDKYGYKWVEYPTNLSPLQSFVSNASQNLTVYIQGTKEHEMIIYKDKKYFAFTLYRAFGLFGTKNVAYRPGRASGANCEAPDCQLLNDKLTFDFIIDFEKRSLQEQFLNASWVHLKNFYIPGQWALSRTLLRWNTNIDYYDNGKNALRNFRFNLDKSFSNLITEAIYKRPNGDFILRFLNVEEKIAITSNNYPISRTLDNFAKQKIIVPKFGLINVLIGAK